jgi:hypothetical protein
MQWPLTSQSHDSILKQNNWFFVMDQTPRQIDHVMRTGFQIDLVHEVVGQDPPRYSADINVSAEADVPAQRGRGGLGAVDEKHDFLLIPLDDQIDPETRSQLHITIAM